MLVGGGSTGVVQPKVDAFLGVPYGTPQALHNGEAMLVIPATSLPSEPLTFEAPGNDYYNPSQTS